MDAKIDDFITWDDSFELGIPMLDKQHRNLLRIINNLRYACHESSEIARLRFKQISNDVVAYIDYHAKTEKKLMLLLEFPEYTSRNKQYDELTTELLKMIKKIDEDKEFFPINLTSFLKDWFCSHVAVQDKSFATYLQNLDQYSKLRSIFS